MRRGPFHFAGYLFPTARQSIPISLLFSCAYGLEPATFASHLFRLALLCSPMYQNQKKFRELTNFLSSCCRRRGGKNKTQFWSCPSRSTTRGFSFSRFELLFLFLSESRVILFVPTEKDNLHEILLPIVLFPLHLLELPKTDGRVLQKGNQDILWTMGKRTCRADRGIKASREPQLLESPSLTTRMFKFPQSKTSLLPLGAFLFLLLPSIILATGINWVQDDGIGFSHHLSPFVDWEHRREAVRNAFVVSWDAYSQHAWGRCFSF